MNGTQRFVLRGTHRADIKILICILLFGYCFFAWRQCIGLIGKLDNTVKYLKILHQMQDYAQSVCTPEAGKPTLDVEKDMELVRLTRRQGVTRKTVEDEITFILMSPTLRCVSGKVSLIRDLFKHVKINIAIDVSVSVLNQQDSSETTARMGYFLGGFQNRAEALNRAIEIVTTKYFMIIDHSVDLASMQTDFVETLLTNMPGFDVLSGSEVDVNGEFHVPCYRVKLGNWTLHESYEYSVSGNILRCDATSLFFLGRTEAFQNPSYKELFDARLASKWLQDFFIRFRGILDVGVLPEVVIYRKIQSNCFHVPPLPKRLSERVNLLLPFADKYQVFYFDNGIDRFSICKDSSKLVCSEEGIGLRWKLKHWSSIGHTAYPFIIESLHKALHFGTRRLKESGLLYVVEGGTLLGLVKLRDILPWDHGDIDTFVYSTRRNVINMVKETQRAYRYNYWLRHTGFHTYVGNEQDTFNGCIVYLTRRVKPHGIIYMRHNGKLFPVNRNVFKFLRDFYGPLYFESHTKITNERSYCSNPGHHACMPDCRWDGCGGGRSAFPGIL